MSAAYVNRAVFPPSILMLPLLFWGAPAVAQTQPPAQSASPSLWTRSDLLGDVGGLRPLAAEHGVSLTLEDTETLLGNVSGGVKQGATMQGLTTATLQVDTQKAFGLAGGTLNVSALQIHGQSLSPPSRARSAGEAG